VKYMEIKETKCKTALSKSNLPGLTYSLNPYKGCQHKCAYCYVPNVLRINRDQWGKYIEIKTNIPTVLSKELKKKKSGIVGISTVTDPYQPVEKKYRLTRYCLEQLLKYDFPICIQTKSSIVTRDIDIISKFTKAEVMISISTFSDDIRKLLEPYSSTINDRLKTLKILSQNSIQTNVFLGPIYPTIKKQDIPNIIDKLIESGVEEIMIDKFNLKPGIYNNITKSLQKNLEVYRIFNEKIENNDYYNEIRKTLFEICNSRNMEVVDAF